MIEKILQKHDLSLLLLSNFELLFTAQVIGQERSLLKSQ